MTKKIKLDVDWDALFPISEVEIANCKVPIQPMGLKQLAVVMNKLRAIGSLLVDAGVTWENYATPEGLIKLASVCLEHSPDVLSEATGVELDDIQRLPLGESVKLLSKVLEVNLEAKGSLEKNFDGLAKNISQLVGTLAAPVEEEVPVETKLN